MKILLVHKIAHPPSGVLPEDSTNTGYTFAEAFDLEDFTSTVTRVSLIPMNNSSQQEFLWKAIGNFLAIQAVRLTTAFPYICLDN